MINLLGIAAAAAVLSGIVALFKQEIGASLLCLAFALVFWALAFILKQLRATRNVRTRG